MVSVPWINVSSGSSCHDWLDILQSPSLDHPAIIESRTSPPRGACWIRSHEISSNVQPSDDRCMMLAECCRFV